MRYILSLIMLLSLNLFAQSPLLTLFNGGFEPETIAYQTRVLADGGTVINIKSVNDAILDAKSNGYYDSLLVWFAYGYGVKKDANNKVTKLYDLSPNNNDAAQADTSKSPTLYADSLHFDGGDYMQFTEVTVSYTVVTVGNPYPNIFGRLITDNGGDRGILSFGGDIYYRFSDGANNIIADGGGLFIGCMVGSTTDAFYSFNNTDMQIGSAKADIDYLANIGALPTGGQAWLGSIEEILLLSSKTQPPVIRAFLNNKYMLY